MNMFFPSLLLLLFSHFVQSQSVIEHIKNESIAEARALIKEDGLLVNETDQHGATAFMWALYHHQLDFARELYQRGADPHQKGLIYLGGGSYLGSPLNVAVKGGGMEMIRFLIEECGIDSDDRELDEKGEENGWAPLHWLATRNDSVGPVFDYLLKKGAQMNIKDEIGNTPLHLAANYNNTVLINKLIKSGADAKQKNINNNTPLAFAWRSYEAAKLLYEYDPDPEAIRSLGTSLVTDLLYKKNYGYAHWLVSNGLSLTGEGGDLEETLLHENAVLYRPELLLFLINHGLDVNAQGYQGKSPLHLAGSRGSIRILLAHGADPNLTDSFDNAPLWYADNYYETKILIDAGANINYVYQGRSLLLRAAQDLSPAFDEVSSLLDLGARADKHDPDYNYEVLKRRLKSNDYETIKILAEHGFQLDVSNSRDKPLLIEMAEEGWRWKPEQVKALLQVGADPNQTDERGETALIAAVKQSDLDMVQLLIDYGADVNLADAQGATPIIHARMPVAKLLLKHGANINHADNDGNTVMFNILARYGPRNTKMEDAQWAIDNGFEAEKYPESLAKIVPYHWRHESGQDQEYKPLLKQMISGKLQDSPRLRTYRQKLLLDAIEQNNLELVTFLLEIGARTDLPGEDGNLLPHYLVAKPRPYEMFELLAKHKLNFNVTNEQGKTPLQLAYETGSVWNMWFLLKQGAKKEQLGLENMPPLYQAIAKGETATIQRLVKEGQAALNADTDIKMSPLEWAMAFDDEKTFDLLLKHGAVLRLVKLNLQFLVGAGKQWIRLMHKNGVKFSASNPGVRQILRGAIAYNKPQIIDELVKAGLNPEAPEINNSGTLYPAIDLGREDMLRKLIDLGIDANRSIEEDEKAIGYLLRFRTHQAHLAYTLFKAGADATGHEEMLLHTLLEKKPEHALEVYEAHKDKISVTKRDREGYSLFNKGAKQGNIDFLKALIANGLQPDDISYDRTMVIEEAVKLGDPEIVALLLGKGKVADLDANKKFGMLYQAAKHRNPAVLKLLLQNGFDINLIYITFETNLFGRGISDERGLDYFKNLEAHDFDFTSDVSSSMMVDAVKSGRLDVLQYLEQSLSVISTLHLDDWRPLVSKAAEEDNYDIAKFLLEGRTDYEGMDLSQSLANASELGSKDMVALLLEYDAAFYKPGRLLDRYGALVKLVEQGHLHLLLLFINKGFNINDTTEYGASLVNYAVESGRFEALKTLAELGANMDNENTFGDDHLLSQAIANRSLDQMKMALDLGASIDYVPYKSPLVNQAMERGFYEGVRFLLKQGADLHQADRFGNTALHVASDNRDPILFEIVGKVKNPDMKNIYGLTPLHMACKNGNTAAVAALLEHGAAVNTSNTDVETPLMTACFTGSRKIAALLLEHGAEVHHVASNGLSTLEYARIGGDVEIVDMVKSRVDNGMEGE